MADLAQTIEQAISDFDNIEAAIKKYGVDVPVGTDTAEYGSKIKAVHDKAYEKGGQTGYSEGYGVGHDTGYEEGYAKGKEEYGEPPDTREVYQGTRPVEWLKMPDYDRLDPNSIYFLFHILPYGDNVFALQTRHDGEATIQYGKCENGTFVANAEYAEDKFAGAGSTAWTYFTKEFNYDDWDKYEMSDGTRQIIIKVTFNKMFRIGFTQKNIEIKDILCNCNATDNYFTMGSGTDRCDYHYMSEAMSRDNFPAYAPAKFVQCAEGYFNGAGSVEFNQVIVKVLNTFKNTVYSECFRNCNHLREIVMDISGVTTWNNPFRGTCSSLRRLIFVGGENLTSFPSDINLNHCALNVKGVAEFINTLPDITSSGTERTINLTNSPAATAGIPEDVLIMAMDKGWTITY